MPLLRSRTVLRGCLQGKSKGSNTRQRHRRTGTRGRQGPHTVYSHVVPLCLGTNTTGTGTGTGVVLEYHMPSKQQQEEDECWLCCDLSVLSLCVCIILSGPSGAPMLTWDIGKGASRQHSKFLILIQNHWDGQTTNDLAHKETAPSYSYSLK